MPTIQKIIPAAALVACLGIAQKATADDGRPPVELMEGDDSIEFMVGNENVTGGFRARMEIAPDLEFFLLQQPSLWYDTSSTNDKNSFGYLGLISLGYAIEDGFNVFAQAEALLRENPAFSHVAPGLGVEIAGQDKDLRISGRAVITAEESPYLELWGAVGYRPPHVSVHVLAELEAITFFSLDFNGPNFNTQRMRVGLRVGPIELGPAVTREEVDGNTSYNVGGALQSHF